MFFCLKCGLLHNLLLSLLTHVFGNMIFKNRKCFCARSNAEFIKFISNIKMFAQYYVFTHVGMALESLHTVSALCGFIF